MGCLHSTDTKYHQLRNIKSVYNSDRVEQISGERIGEYEILTDSFYICIFSNESYLFPRYETYIDAIISAVIKTYKIQTFYELLKLQTMFAYDCINCDKYVKVYTLMPTISQVSKNKSFSSKFIARLSHLDQKYCLKYILKYFIDDVICDSSIEKSLVNHSSCDEIVLNFDDKIKNINDLKPYIIFNKIKYPIVSQEN